MIKQEVNFPAEPKRVYDAIMDEKEHSVFTGAKAKIDNRVGGKFSVWEGYASGENLELVKGEKIVQSWRADDWPKGIMSKVTFLFKKIKNGTKMEFIHEGVPAEFEESIKEGWNEYYWKPLMEYLSRLK